MVDFVLKIPNEFGTKTTVSLIVWEPDSETLTSDIRKPVGYGDSIQKHPGSEGVAALPYFFCSDFDDKYFAYVSDDFEH